MSPFLTFSSFFISKICCMRVCVHCNAMLWNGVQQVPGVLVTMLQNAYDIRIDRKYGTRKAHLIRLVGAASISVALIVGYFGVVTANPSLRKSMFLIGPILVLIGVAASITWGSVTQITSCA